MQELQLAMGIKYRLLEMAEVFQQVKVIKIQLKLFIKMVIFKM